MTESILSLFLKAAGIGLAVAAHVGPMSLLCMRRTLVQGWRSGLATGAGIAAGDGIYAAVAALGLTAVSSLILGHPRLIHGLAGAVLLVLGLWGVLSAASPPAGLPQPAPASLSRTFAGAALLTLANPPTVVMFAAVFASRAPRAGYSAPEAASTVVGVLTGSLAWWCAVVTALSLMRHGLGEGARLAISRAGAGALAVFGLVELARAF